MQCLAPQGSDDGTDLDGTATETTAFVKNLLANVREVVGFLESASGVKSVGEYAVVRCMNQLDRAIRYV